MESQKKRRILLKDAFPRLLLKQHKKLHETNVGSLVLFTIVFPVQIKLSTSKVEKPRCLYVPKIFIPFNMLCSEGRSPGPDLGMYAQGSDPGTPTK